MDNNTFKEKPENAVRALLPLESFLYAPMLLQHIYTSTYGLHEKKSIAPLAKEKDIEYISCSEIWNTIIQNPVKVKRTDKVYSLKNFFLFDWFSRSPGLYFTERAEFARNEAQSRIINIEDGFTIYDPHGKLSMLDGGIGNIRLKPINLSDENYYFLSASSTGRSHEGFPVALPEALYNLLIEEITEKGAVLKNLTGRIKSIPEEIESLYTNYSNVPKIYLLIEGVAEPSSNDKLKKEALSVTVASSFISNYEGMPKTYATYVGFDPSDENAFKKNIEWMENEYVIGMYKGQVLTDFDQTINHFKNAPFSLEKVMSHIIDENNILNLQALVGIDSRFIITYQNKIKEYIKRNKQSEPPVVFISYNHNDMAIAEKLYNRLIAEGLTVIWDIEKTTPHK